jgi:hypothetical protein
LGFLPGDGRRTRGSSAHSEYLLHRRREIVDFREILRQRFPGIEQQREPAPAVRRKHQTVPLTPDEGVGSRQFEIDRNSNDLIAPVPGQFDPTLFCHPLLREAYPDNRGLRNPETQQTLVDSHTTTGVLAPSIEMLTPVI